MKYFYFLVMLFLFHNNIICQTDTIYYNKKWTKIETKDTASFYRIGKITKNSTYEIKDYFITGELQMSGEYKTKKNRISIGSRIWYFQNGKKSKEGQYDAKGYKYGNWTSWFRNGQTKQEYNFDDETIIIFNRWNKDGSIQVKEGNGIYTEYYENGNIKTQGFVKNYKKDKEWIFYTKDGEIDYKEKLSKGKFISGITFRSGKKYPYKLKETMPYFKTCKKIKDLTKRNECTSLQIRTYAARVNYPKSAVDNDIQGKVYIQFFINKEGEVRGVEILKSSGYNILDKTSVKHIKNMPNFIAGTQRGMKVKVRYNIPISFKIEE